MKEHSAQHAASTLLVWARMGWACVVLRECIAQAVANALWVYARMGMIREGVTGILYKGGSDKAYFGILGLAFEVSSVSLLRYPLSFITPSPRILTLGVPPRGCQLSARAKATPRHEVNQGLFKRNKER